MESDQNESQRESRINRILPSRRIAGPKGRRHFSPGRRPG